MEINNKRDELLKTARAIAYFQKGQSIVEVEDNSDQSAKLVIGYMETEGEFAEGLVEAAGYLLFGSQGFDADVRDKALEMTNKAIQLEPNNEDVLEKALFNYQYTIGDYPENREVIVDITDKILDLDPANIQGILSYYLYGKLFNTNFSLQKAIGLLEKARTIDPTRTDVVLDLGTAYAGDHRYNEAIEAYESYIKMIPEDSLRAQSQINAIREKIHD